MKVLAGPWRFTLIECLITVAILVILAAILISSVQWVADGDITIPVEVRDFDAATLNLLSMQR